MPSTVHARLSHLLAASLIAATALATAPARADEAQVHFQRGVELYSEADYKTALLEFKRAYQLEPRYQVLYNIALAEYQLLDYAGALAAYERYLKEGGGEIPPARRAEVEREVGKLEGRVAKLDITSNVDGADVQIDDVSVGKTPLPAPVRVTAGRRKIAVSAPGHTSSAAVIDVLGGDSKRVLVTLGSAEAPASAPTVTSQQPPPRSVPWVGWVVTGAFAVGTGVTGVLALGASSDAKDQLGTLGTTQAAIDSAHNKVMILGIVTDALLGATAVAGGISLYFTLRTPEPAAPASGKSGTRLAVSAVPGGGRLEVTF